MSPAGRPSKGRTVILPLRVEPELARRIDAAKLPGESRCDTMIRLLEAGLEATPSSASSRPRSG